MAGAMDEKREQRTRSISLEGGTDYVWRLKALAALRGQSMGALVREALDSVYGPQLAILCASDNADEHQVMRESSNG